MLPPSQPPARELNGWPYTTAPRADYHSEELECDASAQAAATCIFAGTSICDRKMRYLDTDTVEARSTECTGPDAQDGIEGGVSSAVVSIYNHVRPGQFHF